MLDNPIPDKKLYFLHIPKTAGTSLRSLLERYFHISDICPAFTILDALNLPEQQLQDYRFFRGHMGYNLINLLPFQPYTMVMLRHPVERAISHFYYARKNPGDTLSRELHAQNTDIETFLKQAQKPTFMDNMQSRVLCQNVDAEAMRAACRSSDPKKSLARLQENNNLSPTSDKGQELALQRLNSIEFVGLTDRFHHSQNLLTYQLSLLPSDEVQLLNANNSSDRSSDLPDHLLNMLMEKNAMDMQLYEAAQQRFEAAHASMLATLLTANTDAISSQYSPSQNSNNIEISFESPIVGNGWHQRELYTGSGRYRWTGPGTVATLLLAMTPHTDYRLTVNIIATATFDILKATCLALNDVVFKTNIQAHGNGYQIVGEIPPHLINEANYDRLSIDTDTVAIPTEKYAVQDNRLCGLAITGISLTAIFRRA